MKLSSVRNFILALTFLFLAAFGGYRYGLRAASPPLNTPTLTAPSDVNLTLFWEVWQKLQADYLDKSVFETQKMIDGAIRGMVASIGDPYTLYLSTAENKSAKEDLNGSFEGVGMELQYNRENQIVVVAPLADTPAERAGVKAGDVIIKIGDQTTDKLTLLEAVKLIRGPKGTKIKLAMWRPSIKSNFEVDLERATVLVKSVQLEFKGDIAHVKLMRFGDRTGQELQGAVDQIIIRKAKGVILDMRNNPGGYLSGAVEVASEFLSSGVVVSQESVGAQKEDYSVTRTGRLTEIPLVLLINQGSASASEIVAGALQNHHRAQIVGEKSFGKGTVQESEDLRGGAGLHITVARWLTPNGNSIDKEGIKPDIEIKNEISDGSVEPKDVQLEKALEILNRGD